MQRQSFYRNIFSEKWMNGIFANSLECNVCTHTIFSEEAWKVSKNVSTYGLLKSVLLKKNTCCKQGFSRFITYCVFFEGYWTKDYCATHFCWQTLNYKLSAFIIFCRSLECMTTSKLLRNVIWYLLNWTGQVKWQFNKNFLFHWNRPFGNGTTTAREFR